MASLGVMLLVFSGALLVSAAFSLARSCQSGSSNAYRIGLLSHRAAFGSLTLSCIVLLILFLRRDFGVAYVADYSSKDLPIWYLFSAFWAGQEGSLLLWAWLTALFGLLLSGERRGYPGPDSACPLAVLSLVLVCFVVMLAGPANPFIRLDSVRLDGAGLNPLLQNPAMVIHPPLVFIGYSGFGVAFALALGSLISGDPRGRWAKRARRWALFSWLALSLGIIIGARWAYDELGWGGYWSWDAVENSSLLPWLLGTAFVHSLMVQRTKNELRLPTVLLAESTFIFCVFGAFLTRSGVVSSVHAFAESPIGYYFMGMILLLLAGSLWLNTYRAPYLVHGKAAFGAVSRENSIVLFNLVLVVLFAVVLFGTCYPVFSRLATGRETAVARAFFDRATGPLGIIVVALMGFCPHARWGGMKARMRPGSLVYPAIFLVLAVVGCVLLRYRSPGFLITCAVSGLATGTVVSFFAGSYGAGRSSGKGARASILGLVLGRKSGAYVVHLGVVLIALGVGASSIFKETGREVLAPGEKMTVGDYGLEYVNLDERDVRNRHEVIAELEVTRRGVPVGKVAPAKAYYPGEERPMSEVAVMSGFLSDLYVAMGEVSSDGSLSVEAHVNAMVRWIWVGSTVLFVGGLMALLPARRSPEDAKGESQP